MLTQTKRFRAQITKQLRITGLMKLKDSLEYWYHGRDHNRSSGSDPSREQCYCISEPHWHDKLCYGLKRYMQRSRDASGAFATVQFNLNKVKRRDRNCSDPGRSWSLLGTP